MNDVDLDKLAQLSACWQELIKQKQKRFAAIQNPKNRILPAIKLVSLKLDLAYMEEEFCSHVKVDIYVTS
jgi:hypothetical protein